MIIADFRAQFPEFSDTVAYPDAQLTFWSGVAELMLRKNIWCDTWDFGVKLYTAHEITMATQNVNAAAIGGTPGQSGGTANTKTVGSVSVGYDSVTQSEKDGGWWNRSSYGIQLYRFIKIFGAGGVQL